ncbi:hypothetical protein EYZ11_007392 [Aspergillus tanneri]|uniref:Uncharacterized protein n=1 Tax=Aspergillus tanneri TaxID=1220188 RepID=A0A4S3JDF5_9EURO|nr:hypothetical protein EYZ11_007392 [Aspergillus tanneri]
MAIPILVSLVVHHPPTGQETKNI